jgi:hypothetical protein
MLEIRSRALTLISHDPGKAFKSVMRQSTILAGSIAALGLTMPAARAATWHFDGYTVTLQSTLDYTLGVRTSPLEESYYAGNEGANGLNVDDGDRNFRSGVMENLFQTTEQLNIQNGNYGFRASAQALINTVYLQHSQNNSPNTFNSYGIGPQGFPSGTIANDGRNFRMLAAFVYGAEDFDGGQQRLSWQIGRQTITWGESLFSTDGLSGLQAPVDVNYAVSEPNPQIQALFLPTGAASFSYDLGNGLTADAYWQFEYEPDVYPGVGSYFSFADLLGPGAQRILATQADEGGLSVYRAPDIRPSNGLDQFGFALHDSIGTYFVGAYFIRGIDKQPTTYAQQGVIAPNPAGLQVGRYNIVYGTPTNAIGVSASTTIGSFNVASELSARINQPLTSSADYAPGATANYNYPLYAVGNVVNGEFNLIDLTPPLPLMPNGATVTGEVTLNDVVGATAREAALTPGNTSQGGKFEVTFTPSWFPVQNLEVEFPLGYTNAFMGDSQYDNSEYAGEVTYDIGLEGVYKQNLTFGVNYQRYSGPPDRQSYLDRDFATFYVDKTF